LTRRQVEGALPLGHPLSLIRLRFSNGREDGVLAEFLTEENDLSRPQDEAALGEPAPRVLGGILLLPNPAPEGFMRILHRLALCRRQRRRGASLVRPHEPLASPVDDQLGRVINENERDARVQRMIHRKLRCGAINLFDDKRCGAHRFDQSPAYYLRPTS
jgi:hypothetical protein